MRIDFKTIKPRSAIGTLHLKTWPKFSILSLGDRLGGFWDFYYWFAGGELAGIGISCHKSGEARRAYQVAE